jgi:hypothetical protein
LRLFLQETIELWGKNKGAREGGMKELEMQGIAVVKPLIVYIETQVRSIFVVELFFNGFLNMYPMGFYWLQDYFLCNCSLILILMKSF